MKTTIFILLFSLSSLADTTLISAQNSNQVTQTVDDKLSDASTCYYVAKRIEDHPGDAHFFINLTTDSTPGGAFQLRLTKKSLPLSASKPVKVYEIFEDEVVKTVEYSSNEILHFQTSWVEKNTTYFLHYALHVNPDLTQAKSFKGKLIAQTRGFFRDETILLHQLDCQF